jgi:hypothetical protein
MSRSETPEVISVGPVLNRKNRKLWRSIETDAFQGDSNHAMELPPKGRKGGNSEFFFLCCEGDPVGRVATGIGEGWLSEEKKEEGVGFIDDLIVLPDHKHHAGLLIDRCLSALKERGAEGVIARSQKFPALTAQEFDGLPPGELPTNPPWHIDLFEQKGFVKRKEWANFRLTLPREVSHTEFSKWEAVARARGIEVRRLGWRTREDLKQYAKVACEVLSGHYGYTPTNFMESYSFLRFLAFGVYTSVWKYRIYVLKNQAGEVIGFFSYHPDYQFAIHAISKHSGREWYNPLGLVAAPQFFRTIHTARRAKGGSIGLRKEWRNRGFVFVMDLILKLVVGEGYEQFDTGSVLVDNAVVVKMADSMRERHGATIEQMKYYTLQYDF